jgi:hypothetical protein
MDPVAQRAYHWKTQQETGRYTTGLKQGEKGSMKLKIISCRVMAHELRYCAAVSPNDIDIEFLYQGLHEFPGRLNTTVLDAIDAVEEGSCDYILLNYGICGNGTIDLHHESIPMVIHNVQDCIPILIGDEAFHRNYIKKRPGTFWFSVGWIEGFPLPGSPDYDDRYTAFYSRSIDAGKRDVIEGALMHNYTHLSYVEWKELGESINKAARSYTRECVRSLNERLGMNLAYDHVVGRVSRLQRFVDGQWDSADYLIIEPGRHVKLDLETCRLCAV